MQGDLSKTAANEVAQRLKSLDALPSGSMTAQHLQDLTQTRQQHQSALEAVKTAETDLQRARGMRSQMGCFGMLLVGLLGFLSVAGLCFGITSVVIGFSNAGRPTIPYDATTPDQYQALGVGALVLAIVSGALLIYTRKWPKTRIQFETANAERTLASAQRSDDGYVKTIDVLYEKWLRASEPLYLERMRQLEALHLRANADAEAAYQQRMAEIAAEHGRAMAEIAQRYRQD
jgi:hypothetical protein